MSEKQESTKNLTFFIARFDQLFDRMKRIIFTSLALFIFVCLIMIGIMFIYFTSLVSESQSLDDVTLIQNVTKLPEMPPVKTVHTDLIALYDAPEPALIAGPSEVSPYVTSALVAAEDDQFYLHNGVLPKAVLRAIYQDVFQHQYATGGSTITQQLIKNQLLSSERTYDRKAKEIVYALRVEKLMTKEEIIYTYLNRVPFGLDTNGQHITGITSASYGIFGKPPSTLNLAESAYLTGLLQSPYYYTPFDANGNIRSKEELAPSIHRQHYVLKRMLIENMISSKEYQSALNYDIPKHFQP